MVHFDWSISLGVVLNVVTFIITAAMGLKKLGHIETKVDALWSWFLKEHNLD
jgi:hypothetical protein